VNRLGVVFEVATVFTVRRGGSARLGGEDVVGAGREKLMVLGRRLCNSQIASF
jgi:hypothetical protein